MSQRDRLPAGLIAITHSDINFERKSVYLTGQVFRRCTFRSCTLIIKDMAMLCIFEDCRFENCVFYLNMTVMHRREWQHFLTQLGPAILASLPDAEEE